MQKRVEIALAVITIGATLAFGGVQPLVYSLLEACIFAALLVVLVIQTRRGRIQLPAPIWPFLFAAFVVLQMVPLPAAWIARLNPERLLPSGVLALEPGLHSLTTLSIYPHATALDFAKLLAYIAAFVLAAYVFDSHQKTSLLIRVLIFLGLFEAAYGIVQYLTGWQKIFTYKKIYYTNAATGTFINHNHFAGFIELTFPFVLALVFYYFQVWQEGRRHGRVRGNSATVAPAGVQTIFFGFLLVVAVIAVIFSRSRGGILATFLTIVFVGLLAQLKTKKKAWMLGLAAFVLIAVGYGLWIGLNPVISRFEAFGGGMNYLQAEGRLSFWRSSLGLIRAHPVLGIGLGAFQWAFSHFQTTFLTYTVDHAHNDYVELIAETGVLGAALLFIPIFGLLVRMIHSFLTDSRRYRPSITLGCIGATLALLIHSVTDFNLHVPANALVFAMVLGIGYKAACLERRGERTAAAKSARSEHPATAGRVARRQTVN
ncbi:MAG: O-antigen ligase family protein [Terriglobia bacterium]